LALEQLSEKAAEFVYVLDQGSLPLELGVYSGKAMRRF
jgi:hypothetical protein